MEWAHRSAEELARVIRAGEVTAEDAVCACLEHIRQVEAEVQAWAFLDPDYSLAQARQADRLRREGRDL